MNPGLDGTHGQPRFTQKCQLFPRAVGVSGEFALAQFDAANTHLSIERDVLLKGLKPMGEFADAKLYRLLIHGLASAFSGVITV